MDEPELAGARGREVLELYVFPDTEQEPRPGCKEGAQTTSYTARSIAWLREKHGGDAFVVHNPTTGRRHRVRLQPYGDLNPDHTLVQIRFHFFPAPFASREAQLLQTRARNELRRLHEQAIAIHDAPSDEAYWGPPTPGMPAQTRADGVGSTQGQIHSFAGFCTRLGLLYHHETVAIHNEYATRRPELFHRYD